MDPAPRFEASAYRAAGKLVDKVALITGGDSGIGRAVAVLFAREGADVVISHLPAERGDALRTLRYVEAAGRAGIGIEADLTTFDAARRLVEQAVERFGRIDLVVNNAAVQKHVDRIEDLDVDQWDRTFRTNISGYFFVTKAALGHLGPGSAIINTGSVAGLEGSRALLDYSATKGAIHAFTKSLAQQLVSRRIRVNCVAPGPVWTPLNPAERDDEEVRRFGSGTPMGRPAQPEEIAPTYVYLASEADSRYMTGQVLALLGGETTAG